MNDMEDDEAFVRKRGSGARMYQSWRKEAFVKLE